LYLALRNENDSHFWGLIFNIHRSFDPGWHAVCGMFWILYALYWDSTYILIASLRDVDYDLYSIMAFLLGVSHCTCCILHLGKYLTPKTTWFNSKDVVNRGDCVDCVCHNLSFVWIWVVGIDDLFTVWDNSILASLATESWYLSLIASLSTHIVGRYFLISHVLKTCTDSKGEAGSCWRAIMLHVFIWIRHFQIDPRQCGHVDHPTLPFFAEFRPHLFTTSRVLSVAS